MAGQRSRQKKKSYIASLEEEVRRLSSQVEDYETELSKCKDRLVDALKASHASTNEHAYTFTEMERIIKEEDPNLDRLNLLIDLLKVSLSLCRIVLELAVVKDRQISPIPSNK